MRPTKSMKYVLLLSILLIQLLDSNAASASEKKYSKIQIGDNVPNVTLWGSAGKRYKLKKYKGSIIVLEWLDLTCDLTKKMYDSGDIQEIQQIFIARSDVFWASVHSVTEDDDRYKKPNDMLKQTMKDRAYPDTVIIDKKLRAAKIFGIKKVPAFVVIDADGKLAYRGELQDDKHNYVTEAIEQLLAAGNVTISETRISDGCIL